MAQRQRCGVCAIERTGRRAVEPRVGHLCVGQTRWRTVNTRNECVSLQFQQLHLLMDVSRTTAQFWLLSKLIQN